jgi:putative ABC transport system permease protein
MFYKIVILFYEAIKATKNYKLRGILSIVSIALGIIGVTVVSGSINGARLKIYELLGEFGSDSILIIGGSQTMGIYKRMKTLTFADAAAIKEAFPEVYISAPMSNKSAVSVSFKGNRLQTNIIGSSEDYALAWNTNIESGVDITARDVKTFRKVCLLGSYAKEKLLGISNPLNNYLLINNFYCKIIGVLEEKGVSSHGHNINDRIVIPVTTLSRFITGEYTYVNFIKVRIDNPSKLSDMEKSIKNFLRMRHRLLSHEADDFILISPNEILKFFIAITGSMILFLSIITILSIVVGGFVVANLFLLSVQDRTSEIGIRRTFGAKKIDIFIQFIFEILVLSLMGSFLGFLLGIFISHFLKASEIFEIKISPIIFILVVFSSICISFIFGFAPAKKAANVDPIKAIRTE